MNNLSGDSVRLRLRVIKTIDERRLLSGVKKVLIGFSGGIDSSVLFDVLLSLRVRYNFTLYALHFNHMIRGAESDADEESVKQRCREAGITLFTVRSDIPALARAQGKSLELAARDARYKAFYETAEQNGIDAVATAHNADDNAETVIYNLARGAGLCGIRGIPYRRGNIIRPLLDVPRKDIELYAKRRNIVYVNDSSNSDETFSRNKIRRRVIPVLKEINSSFIETLTAESNYFETVENHIKNEAAALDGDISEHGDAVILQYIYDRCPVFCDSETACRMLQAIKSKKRRTFMVSDGIKAVTEAGRVNFGSFIETEFDKIEYTPLTVGENILAGGKVTVFYNCEPKNFNDINNFSTTITLRSVIIREAIYVRARAEGDTLRVNGMTKSVKKEFINKKIPAALRGLVPVVCAGTDIVCVPYVGVSDKYKAITTPGKNECCTFTFCLNRNNNPEKEKDGGKI